MEHLILQCLNQEFNVLFHVVTHYLWIELKVQQLAVIKIGSISPLM